MPTGPAARVGAAAALIGVLGVTCGWSAIALGQSTSPGPLATSHKKWDNRCETCHVAGKGVSDDRCLECHKTAKTSRYHWKMAQDAGKACAKCHRDHQGRGFRMVRWRAPRVFDHGLTGWKLQGRHTKLACKGCHTTPQRWMGLGSKCVNCHADTHKPTLGPDCANCHSQQRFAPAPRFSHDRARFQLRGKHREVQCGKCHTSNASAPRSAQGTPAKRGASALHFRGLSFASCVSCHADPTPDHSRGEACETCHTERSWRRTRKDSGLRLHTLLPFKLTNKHAVVACATCHTPRRRAVANTSMTAGAARARLQAFEGLRGTCVSCHKDVHKGQFGDRCQDCHTTAGWDAKRSQRGFDHNRTSFALRGRHRAVRCERCHAPAKSYKRQYTQIPHDTCGDCHGDVHVGTFRTVATDKSVIPKSTKPTKSTADACQTCHSEGGFAPANFSITEHEGARVALTGAHRVVPCQGCHTPSPTPKTRSRGKVNARAPGQVARLVGTPQTCVDCHKDAHAGQFDGRKPPLTCTACHTERAFRPAERFDHDKTTFKLTGPHAKTACAGCHQRPSAGAPVRFAGVATACASCHSDVHAGQFLSDGPKRTCEDCHQVVKDFVIEKFAHDNTRFPLRGKHGTVDCARCHTKVAGPGGDAPGARIDAGAVTKTNAKTGAKTDTETDAKTRGLIHYRLGALACGRCHSNPHERLRGVAATNAGREGQNTKEKPAATGKKPPTTGEKPAATAKTSGAGSSWSCNLCHVPEGWQVIPKRVAFDHDRTGVPLTGAHATAPCVGCHKQQTSTARSTRVPRACLSCHTDTHRGEQGSQCESCHTSRSWQRPRQFTPHAVGRFPLSGVHAVVACASCHRTQARDQFRGTPSTCDACHKTTALAITSFDHRPLRMGCNQCHSTFAWAPARFDHAAFWPLLGSHATIATQCGKCHSKDTYAGLSRSCASCHGGLVTAGKTHPDHRTLGLTTTCERCHTPTAWSALKSTWHDKAFPISNGDHSRYRSSCTSCHPAGVGKGKFDCVHCHDGEHSKAKMDSKHAGEVGGYVWDNGACMSCHPKGDK